jgi:hypothetical protein
MKKRISKRYNSKDSNNINNIVEYIGLSKFEKNPVIKPSDLTQQSKEAPRPLLPNRTYYTPKKKKREKIN